MIDIEHETLIRLNDVAKLLPTNGRTGRRIHVSAIYRWAQSGRLSAHGKRTKLETTKLGGSTYTSVEAVQRFADRLCATEAERADDSQVPRTARQRQVNRATMAADRLLGGRVRRDPIVSGVLVDQSQ